MKAILSLGWFYTSCHRPVKCIPIIAHTNCDSVCIRCCTLLIMENVAFILNTYTNLISFP